MIHFKLLRKFLKSLYNDYILKKKSCMVKILEGILKFYDDGPCDADKDYQ